LKQAIAISPDEALTALKALPAAELMDYEALVAAILSARDQGR